MSDDEELECNKKYNVHHWNKEIPLCPVCSQKDRSEVTTIEEVYTALGKEVPIKIDVTYHNKNKTDELKKEFDKIDILKKLK
jgi:hypothetical protein